MDHPFDVLSRKKNPTEHECLLLAAIICLSTEETYLSMTFAQIWNQVTERARQMHLPLQPPLSSNIENKSLNQKRVVGRKSKAAGEPSNE